VGGVWAWVRVRVRVADVFVFVDILVSVVHPVCVLGVLVGWELDNTARKEQVRCNK
jgi:hypothetical protein